MKRKRSISEEDADSLLDYRDNVLPLYGFEIERYQRELETIFNAMLQEIPSSDIELSDK